MLAKLQRLVSTRRVFLRRATGVLLLASGGWLLARLFLPRRPRPAEVESFAAFVDTLLPDGEIPGARRTGIVEPLLRHCESDRHGRRALIEGVAILDREARRRGAATFATLDVGARTAIVEGFARADQQSVPGFLYRTVRDRAMQLHYAPPAAWGPLRFSGPPQPNGHYDYQDPPDV